MNTLFNARTLAAAAIIAFAAFSAPAPANAAGFGGLTAGHELRADAQIEKTASLRQRLRDKWDEYKNKNDDTKKTKSSSKKKGKKKFSKKLKDRLSKYF